MKKRRSHISGFAALTLSAVLLTSGVSYASGTARADSKKQPGGSLWASVYEQTGNGDQKEEKTGFLSDAISNLEAADQEEPEAGKEETDQAASEAGQESTDQAASEAGQESTDQAASEAGQESTDQAVAETGAETAQSDGTGAQSATVMIYLNGSDLESQNGAATSDISEMLRAGVGEKVNVVMETLGTREWKGHDISSDTAQRWRVNGSQLELVQDDLGQLDATSQQTLSDFVGWASSAYPADRYILLLWDHGGGAVYGYGYDEWQSEEAALTIDEIRGALETNSSVHFDFIGMDACLMSSLEVCLALAPYCSYTILSEDFESNIGWYYTDWMKELETNPGIGSVELGKVIVDTMLAANKADKKLGEESTLAVIDESKVEELFTAWTRFAYANEDLLLGNNYSTKRRSKGRVLPKIELSSKNKMSQSGTDHAGSRYDGGFSYGDEDDVHYSEYYVTDIMAVASNTTGDGTAELESAVSNAIAYMDSTSSETLTGIGVTLPYGDGEFYQELQQVFSNCSLDSEYIEWLQKFVDADGSGSYYDYDRWYESWDGWSGWYEQVSGHGPSGSSDQADSYDDDYGDDGYYDDGYSDDGYIDDGYYDDGYSDDGYYDDGYSDDGHHDAGWYESLYGSYGEEGESYDEWYDEWYDGWCDSCA